MEEEEENFISYIDLLASALGAGVMLMLILSLQINESQRPPLPVDANEGWAELRVADTDVAWSFRAARVEGSRPPVWQARRMASQAAVDIALPDKVDGEVVLELSPLKGSHDLLAHLAVQQEFDLLTAPEAYGPAAPHRVVHDFQQSFAELRSRGAIAAARLMQATTQLAGKLDDLRPLFPLVTLCRLEQFVAQSVEIVDQPFSAATRDTAVMSVEVISSGEGSRSGGRRWLAVDPRTQGIRLAPGKTSSDINVEVIPLKGDTP